MYAIRSYYAPLFAALFSRLFLQEKTPPRTWLAIFVAIAGVAWVMADSLGGGRLTGDLLAAGATLLTGGYFTVITSYSIHYTKLYEILGASRPNSISCGLSTTT